MSENSNADIRKQKKKRRSKKNKTNAKDKVGQKHVSHIEHSEQDESFSKQSSSKRKINAIEEIPHEENIELVRRFEELGTLVHKGLLQAVIDDMGFQEMTEVQYKAIPPLLKGKDLIGTAKTGSGKTLAFLIPAVEMLLRKQFQPAKGTGILVVSPTRELSLQTYEVVQGLLAHYPHISHQLVVGKTDRRTQTIALERGVNVLVATPGRLLDHLQAKNFKYDKLFCLILDEADKILGDGFEEQIKTIISFLPKQRQTMLFSATMDAKTQELATLALRVDHVSVSAGQNDSASTVAGLHQQYILAPISLRLQLLSLMVNDYKDKKVLVFFGCCDSVEFHFLLFSKCGFQVSRIHGKLEQEVRTQVFEDFRRATSGTLFCTDVAARGLDIQGIDIVMQYDPPKNVHEYIHRVGRTARGVGGQGSALIFLQPHEQRFLHHLSKDGVPITQRAYSAKDISPRLQPLMEKLVRQHPEIQSEGEKAFQSYFRSYNVLNLKDAFPIDSLQPAEVSQSFALPHPPLLDMEINLRKAKKRKRNQGLSPAELMSR